jgi:hypothetical protein
MILSSRGVILGTRIRQLMCSSLHTNWAQVWHHEILEGLFHEVYHLMSFVCKGFTCRIQKVGKIFSTLLPILFVLCLQSTNNQHFL